MQPSHDPTGILYIDDEEQALKYFTKALGKDYQVTTFADPAAALVWLQDHANDIDVVVSDMRMPQMSGAEVLGRIRRDHPSITRILTTAYSDLDDAIQAVNQGEIYHYVNKPWNILELRTSIKRAAEHVRLVRERDLLLSQKLGVFQGIIELDRLRALTVAIPMLGDRLRHWESGLAQYCRATLPTQTEPGTGVIRDPWQAITMQTLSLQSALREFALAVSAAEHGTEQQDLMTLLHEGPWQVAVSGSAELKVDRNLFETGLLALINSYEGDDLQIAVEDSASQANLVISGDPARLRTASQGAITGTTDPHLGSLPLCLTATHHGGTFQSNVADLSIWLPKHDGQSLADEDPNWFAWALSTVTTRN